MISALHRSGVVGMGTSTFRPCGGFSNDGVLSCVCLTLEINLKTCDITRGSHSYDLKRDASRRDWRRDNGTRWAESPCGRCLLW